MKQKIQKFPDFLVDRFQPCIICSFSDEVSRIIPDIMDQINAAWDQINIENKSKVRMIFPKCKVDINLAVNEIINMPYSYSQTEPYDFLNKEPIIEQQNELPTMTILRQRLFESDFMPYHLYCDIPISILLFTSKNENPFPSKSYFPDWSHSIINSIRPDVIKLPIKDFLTTLRDFFNKKYIPKLMKSEQAVIHNRQSIKSNNWFSILNEPSSKMLAVKYYADLRMQQRQYGEAITEYKRLFETPLGQQCRFLSMLCKVMNGEEQINDLDSIGSSISDNNVIEIFAIQMTKLYFDKSINTMKQILPFGRIFIVLNPFLYEQYAYLLSLRKRSYMLYYSSRGFSSINSPEFEVRCLYNSWGIVHPHNFNFVAQKLIENALEKYTGDFVSRLIELALSCREISHPQFLQLKLSLIFEERNKKSKKLKMANGKNTDQSTTSKNEPAKKNDTTSRPLIFVPPKNLPSREIGEIPIHCGFVDSCIIKLESNGFPCAPPEGFTGYWPKTAQQLFGSFDHKRFFTSNIFNFIECATDEVITIKVFFHNRCPSFMLTNAKLRTSGTAKVETFPELPGEETGHIINTKFIARSKGTIEISGIEFDYISGPSQNYQSNSATSNHIEFLPYEERGVVKFVKIFPGSSISFTVYDKSPRIDLFVTGGKNDIFVDEIVPLTVRIKNGPIKLKYLALMAVGNAYYEVLSPQTEELSGQRFIKDLEPFEEFIVKVAVCGKIIGKNQLMLIFPFWSFEPPCRYNYCNFEFNVHHAPEIPLFMQNEEVVGQCPNDYRAFGFTAKSFDARVFITKLEGRNCHMSLIRALNAPSKIMYNRANSNYTILKDENTNKINNNENSNDSIEKNQNKNENKISNDKNENKNTDEQNQNEETNTDENSNDNNDNNENNENSNASINDSIEKNQNDENENNNTDEQNQNEETNTDENSNANNNNENENTNNENGDAVTKKDQNKDKDDSKNNDGGFTKQNNKNEKIESDKNDGNLADTEFTVLKVQNPDFYYELPDFCRPFIADKEGILFWYKSDRSFVFASLDLTDSYVSAVIERVEENHKDHYDLFKLTLKNISKKRIKDTRVSFVEMNDDISYLFSGVSVKSVGVLEVGQSFEYKFRMKLLFDEASPIVMISGENFAIVHPIVIRRSQL